MPGFGFVPSSLDFGPARFPVHPGALGAQIQAETTALAGPSDDQGPWHNPLVAFGAIAALTFGLMAFSTTVRVGKTRASITLGDTA